MYGPSSQRGFLLIVAVVLVGGLSAVGIYALTKKSNNSTNTAAPGTTTAAPATTGATSRPTAAAPTTPAVKNTDSIYAKVGDCLADLPTVPVGEDREAPNARVVGCTDSTGAYVVAGRLEQVTDVQARDQTICDQFQGATFVYRVVPENGTGYVLCLTKKA